MSLGFGVPKAVAFHLPDDSVAHLILNAHMFSCSYAQGGGTVSYCWCVWFAVVVAGGISASAF